MAKPPVSVRPGEWDGDPHVLTVHAVTPPESEWDDGELDYDIEHPASCRREQQAVNGVPVTDYWDCAVGFHLEDGLAASLAYSGTPVTEPGTYQIRAWAREYWTECGTEYDGSITLIGQDTTSGNDSGA